MWRLPCAVLVLALLWVCPSRLGAQSAPPTAVRPPTTAERAALKRAFNSVWGGRYGFDSEFADLQREAKPPVRSRVRYLHLRAHFLSIRVSRANPRLASMAIELRDPRGGAGLAPAIVVFQRQRRRWVWVDGPDAAFPNACSTGTPLGLRQLLCPDPWSVLGLRPPAIPPFDPGNVPLASADLHAVRWRNLTLPGFVCGSRQTIRLHGGSGFVYSALYPWWPRVEAGVLGISYGDLDGDGHAEAALKLACGNAGGTADGELSYAYVVFTGTGGSLRIIGVLGPQQPLQPELAPAILSAPKIVPGTITVHEAWYGAYDSTCCPTGRATSVWAYVNGTLSLRSTVVDRRPARHPHAG